MQTVKLFLLLMVCFSITNCEPEAADSGETTTAEAVDSGRQFYQLKTYTFENDAQVEATDAYLKEAYLPALKQMNLGPIGVFKAILTETDTVRTTRVLIPFSSMDQFLMLEDQLAKDQSYVSAGSAYINAAHDQAPYQRIESVLMKAFEDMPMMAKPNLEGPRADRVYELRSYESATERLYKIKVDMFNAGGEVKLFNELGFNAVFYAEVLSGAKMPNLMYMTTFSDMASRDEHWDAFREAPAWLKLKAMEKYKNSVSHADIFFLQPTEYSDY